MHTTAAMLTLSTIGLLMAGCDESTREPSDVPELVLDALPPLRPGAAPGGVPFGRIADLEIGPDGSLFILDRLNRTVRVFDQGGTEVRVIGGRGQGPGEFEEPAHLMWGPGGNLWVMDVRNGRLTEFDREGGLVATYRPSDLPIVYLFALGFSGPDALRLVGLTSPDASAPAAASFETRLDSGVMRPVSRADLPRVEWPLSFEHQEEDIALVLPVPFSGEPLFAFDPAGRLWYAHTARPVVQRWSTSGEIEATLGRDPTPRPVTPADRERAVAGPRYEEVRTRLGQAGIAEISAMIPDTRPYLEGFFFDDKGNIWVIRADDGGSSGEARAIDVYDESGTAIALAHAALAATPRPRVRDGLLAAVARDELDVESVVLYRMNR